MLLLGFQNPGFQTCNEADNVEWVIEFPYMTNGPSIKYCKTNKKLSLSLSLSHSADCLLIVD